MAKIYLGKNKEGACVYLSQSALNPNLFCVGQSGTGKTQTLLSAAVQAAEQGEHVLVINWKKTVDSLTVDPELYARYETCVNIIDVAEEGLGLPLFSRLTDQAGKQEKTTVMNSRTTAILKNACKLSPTQESMVYTALCDINSGGIHSGKGLHVLFEWLMSQNKSSATAAAGKILPLCEEGLIKDGNFLNFEKPIIEINLNNLEYDHQATLVNLLLDLLLRLANKGFFIGNSMILFLDEIQQLSFIDSPIDAMLNESRRLGLKLYLACPRVVGSAKKGMDTLLQCATGLFFKPLDKDRKELVDSISTSPEKAGRVNYALFTLDRGECIGRGKFNVNGEEVEELMKISIDTGGTKCQKTKQ